MSDWEDVSLPEGWRLVVIDETSSTNDEVRLRGDESAGLVVVAERQTAGRGRRGAAWVSVPGESLTFSVLLNPSQPKALWPRLSLATGLAVAEALGRFGVEAQIKWPNDVLVGGRKICGILVEAAADHVIVGIGLNVGTREFPEGLEATSMRLEGGVEHGRAEVLGLVLEGLRSTINDIGDGFPGLLERIRERCALSGEQVTLTAGDRQIEGKVLEIGRGGELVLETANGRESFVQAHEIRFRK